MERLGATLQLMVLSFLLSFLSAIPLGIISALKRYSLTDWFVTVSSLFGISVPTFWFGLMAQLIFAVYLRWLPSGGQYTIGRCRLPRVLVDRLKYIIMPACGPRPGQHRRLEPVYALLHDRRARPGLHPHGPGQGPPENGKSSSSTA